MNYNKAELCKDCKKPVEELRKGFYDKLVGQLKRFQDQLVLGRKLLYDNHDDFREFISVSYEHRDTKKPWKN